MKTLSPRSAKLFLEKSEINPNPSKKNQIQKDSRIKTTNPKIKMKAAKTPTNQKKPTEVSEKELFTDISYPTGFSVKLFYEIIKSSSLFSKCVKFPTAIQNSIIAQKDSKEF